MKRDRKEYFKEYRDKNKEMLLEKRRAYNKEYYAANRERINSGKRKKYNTEVGISSAKERYSSYYKKKFEKIMEYQRKYYQEKREQILEEIREFNKMFGKRAKKPYPYMITRI